MFTKRRLALFWALILPMILFQPTVSGAACSYPEEGRPPSVLFIENAGQWQEQVRFRTWGAGALLELREDEVILFLPDASKQRVRMTGNGRAWRENLWMSHEEERGHELTQLRLKFANASPHPVLQPFRPLKTHVSFFYGRDPAQWQPDVPVWGGVRYVNLWPGVDLVLISQHGRLVTRLEARPGADTDAVGILVEGADDIAPRAAGLALSASERQVIWPVQANFDWRAMWRVDDQVIRQLRIQPNPGRVEAAAESTESFIAVPVDNPNELLYGTYLGGVFDDWGYAIAVDSIGAMYVTGMLGPEWNGQIFVLKLDATGSRIEYLTLLWGGSEQERGEDIVVDDEGNAYVVGEAGENFPTTPGVMYPDPIGGGVYFKLGPSGDALIFSTFTKTSLNRGLAVDDEGNGLLSGVVLGDDVPGFQDGFVMQVNRDASQTLFRRALSGENSDEPVDVAVNSQGEPIVVGWTNSPDFPITEDALQPKIHLDSCNTAPCRDGFLLHLSADGSVLKYGTFLGGRGQDGVKGVAVWRDHIFVTGFTHALDFPTTPSALVTYSEGHSHAFVMHFSPEHTLIYGALLAEVTGEDIVVDEWGSATIVGTSDGVAFPTTRGALLRARQDPPSGMPLNDAIVARLDPTGRELTYATFLGGWDFEEGKGLDVDASGSVYVVGGAWSDDFPITANAIDSDNDPYQEGWDSYVQYYDAFIVKLAAEQAIPAYRAATRPIIDGDLSDWPRSPGFRLDDITAREIAIGAVPSPSDASAWIWARWDDDVLYLAIRVVDDVIVTDSSRVWEDDSVEAGVDGLTDGVPDGEDDHQFTVAADGRRTDFGEPFEGFNAAVRRRADGWDVEMAIPVDLLGRSRLQPGQVIGVNWGLNDDDDGDDIDAYLLWRGAHTWRTEPTWGRLQLLDANSPYGGPWPGERIGPGSERGRTLTLQEGVQNYTGARDAYLSFFEKDRNFGGEPLLELGPFTHKALFSFDLEGLPSHATIERALLEVFAADGPSIGQMDVGIWQLLKPWEEMEVTWLQASEEIPWDNEGVTGESDRRSLGLGTSWSHSHRWLSVDVTEIVQQWALERAANYGLIFDAAGWTEPSAPFEFVSKDADDEELIPYRPKLVVTYLDETPTPTPQRIYVPLIRR